MESEQDVVGSCSSTQQVAVNNVLPSPPIENALPEKPSSSSSSNVDEGKKRKNVKVEVKLRDAPCHPTFLLANLYTFNAMKIIVGYTRQFDVKILLLTVKKASFVQLSPFGFTNLFLQCEKIYQDMQADVRKVYSLEERKIIRLATLNKETVVCFEDIYTQHKINYSKDDFTRLMQYRQCLSYTVQNLLFNKGNVLAFYNSYIQQCLNFNTRALELHQMINFGNDMSPFPIDYVQLFHQIPIVMAYRIERDMQYASLIPPNLYG